MNLLGTSVWVSIIFILAINRVRSDGTEPSDGPKKCTSPQDCQWQNSNTDPKKRVDWTWVEADGDEGEGPYLTLQNKSLKGSAVRSFISPQQDFTSEGCLTFSMGIFMGATLQVVIAQTPESEGKIVWAREQRIPQWHEANVRIKPDGSVPFYIILRGVLNIVKKQTINVRNIEISTEACPTQSYEDKSVIAYCDFDEHVDCGWKKGSNWVEGSPFWNRPDAAMQRFQYLGHHLYSKAYGYYMQVTLEKITKDTSRVDMISRQFENPSNDPICLQLYYVLSGGKNSGTFSVSVKTDNDQTEVITISGTQGGRWREAMTTINEKGFAIVISYTPGPDVEKMAVDDIRLSTGECKLFDLDTVDKVSCKIEPETDGCKVRSDPIGNQMFQIQEMQTKGVTEKVAVHEVDQINPERKTIAFLTTEKYSIKSTRTCLTFSYAMSIKGGPAGLLVLTSGNDFVGPKWYRRVTDTQGWRTSMVELEVANVYEIEFETFIFANTTGSVAIRSYEITNSKCPTSDTNLCNFDSDDTTTCGWTDDSNIWSRTTGRDSWVGMGPNADHTTYSMTGYYMLFNTANVDSGTSARLTKKFPATDGTQDYCLSFWYSMFGKSIQPLRVVVKSEDSETSKETEIWFKQKSMSRSFVYGQANVNASLLESRFQISFVSSVGKPGKTEVAIDDVDFEEGGCETFID